MERFFNTAGPQKVDINYTIDPLSRINLDDIKSLIRQQRYFVLHAPRQTGKTSCMLALRDYLNEEGDYIVNSRLYHALYVVTRCLPTFHIGIDGALPIRRASYHGVGNVGIP